MAIARDTTTANIKPLEGAIVRRFTAGSAIEPGEVVSMSSDGYIDPADGSAVATTRLLGVALAVKNQAAAYASGDRVDVVIFGPVQCVTGGTPGAVCYISDTEGEPAETAGTKSAVVGIVESATVVLVNPYIVAFS